ncbi:MAG: hypothetical protein KJN95_11120 [Gammaproteobacteria bacterium]|nr:hypothetical protein [Gammaproteobacteria bacterium]
MHSLKQLFVFNLLLVVLSAGLYQAAIADNTQTGSSAFFCDLTRMLPDSAQVADYDRCIEGGGLHCIITPACNTSSSGFSALVGNAFEPARLVVKSGYHRHSPPLYTFYANRPLRPPIIRSL